MEMQSVAKPVLQRIALALVRCHCCARTMRNCVATNRNEGLRDRANAATATETKATHTNSLTEDTNASDDVHKIELKTERKMKK